MLKKAAMAVFTLILYVYPVSAETLDAEKFIRIASENDIRFELLLADEMKAKYIRGLLEPPADILASVRGNYAFNLPGQDRENRSLSVSLSKLFPRIGSARLSAYYSHNESAAAGAQASAAGISASLPVIRNGFGFVDRILIDIAGYEQEIAVMQAVDAYEDYMAYLLKLYYSWYSSYASVETALAAAAEGEKLYNNIRERRRNNIAFDVDVNKAKMQYIEKKERYLEIKLGYTRALNLIKQITGIEGPVPEKPGIYAHKDAGASVEELYKKTRAGKIMELAVKKAGAAETAAFNYLLPSVYLNAGYETTGAGTMLEANKQGFFAGVSADLPLFMGARETARYETDRIEAVKQRVNMEYGERSFIRELEDIREAIKAQEEIAALAVEKEKTAAAVLADERKNYSQARISFNDLINAVNSLEAAKFNRISAEALLSSYLIEWARLTDRLVVRDK